MAEDQQPTITLQQAVQIAINSVRDLYKGQGYELNDLLLEEIQRSGDTWQVTVGFTRPITAASDLGAVGQALLPRRAFKRVMIDANTGRFLGMEIRELQSTSQR